MPSVKLSDYGGRLKVSDALNGMGPVNEVSTWTLLLLLIDHLVRCASGSGGSAQRMEEEERKAGDEEGREARAADGPGRRGLPGSARRPARFRRGPRRPWRGVPGLYSESAAAGARRRGQQQQRTALGEIRLDGPHR